MSESNMSGYKPDLFTRFSQNCNGILIKSIAVISLQHKTLTNDALPKYFFPTRTVTVVVDNTSYVGSKCSPHKIPRLFPVLILVFPVFYIRPTINRRTSCLFGIGSLTSTFLLLFASCVYKFIASNSYFPPNSIIDELRITLDFWQIYGLSAESEGKSPTISKFWMRIAELIQIQQLDGNFSPLSEWA